MCECVAFLPHLPLFCLHVCPQMLWVVSALLAQLQKAEPPHRHHQSLQPELIRGKRGLLATMFSGWEGISPEREYTFRWEINWACRFWLQWDTSADKPHCDSLTLYSPLQIPWKHFSRGLWSTLNRGIRSEESDFVYVPVCCSQACFPPVELMTP